MFIIYQSNYKLHVILREEYMTEILTKF